MILCTNIRGRIITFMVLGLVFVPFLMRSEDSLCSTYVPQHFQSARDSIIRTWTALDLLRSMAIKPEHRMQFANQIFDDMLMILIDVNALTSSCVYCKKYCSERQEDLLYLEELMVHLVEAFRVVFTPLQDGQEQSLHAVLLKTLGLVDALKQHLSKSQSQSSDQKSNF